MPLPHFQNVITATNIDEPVYSNLFEITFSFPTILKLSAGDETEMMLNATNISTDLTKDLGVAEQFFKYSGRLFLTTAKKNSVVDDLKITFNINMDDKFSMRTWNFLKKWYDLGWNSQTGELHYKKEMIGTVVAHLHDRKGQVYRRVEYVNVQLKGLKGQEYSWDKEEILSGEVSLIADYFIDQYYNIVG